MGNPIRRSGALVALGCIAGLCCLTGPLAAQENVQATTEKLEGESTQGEQANRLFTLKVLPLLRDKCFGCHGNNQEEISGEYDMLSRSGLLRGGESGEPAIIPGNAADSILFQAICWDGYEMPPKENDRLSDLQIEQVRRWIDAGAPWPNEETRRKIQEAEWAVTETTDGIIVSTSGGLSEDWTYRRYQPEDIWAFQPLRDVSLEDNKPGQNPVDYFVNRKLAEKALQPAGPAEAATWLRRATYDLTGLPPTMAETEAFCEQYSADADGAVARAIDRLLASPHYGERWGQHWLDVVRYADTAGFSNDYERSNAWRYRDYVIRSFNSDKPYNEFVVEQIAGDELKSDSAESRIATGFLRMGPWGTAMIPQEEARQIYLDDLVHNVGQSFLSIPMRCCKCHDHKFDPVPTRDYYGMYAAFSSTQVAELEAEFLPEENLNGFDEKRALVEELWAFARAELKQVNDKQEAAARKWYDEHNLPYKNEQGRKNDPEDMKPPRHVGLTPEEQGIKKVREQDVWIWERRLERYQPMIQSVYNGQNDFKNARKLRLPKNGINEKWRPKSFILGGGSLEAKLEAVMPGVLSAITFVERDSSASEKIEKQEMAEWQLTEGLSGRRLQLARWITNDQNPLAARSIVNRIWQYHFGVGLVKTSNNLGVKGDKASHPDLLDWLAADFVKHGWKIKRMHRLIMSSEAYRRNSTPANWKQQQLVDADNRLLSAFPSRRLTAEELRDSMLQISGELNREMGGVPIAPEINMEVALQPRMIQFSIAPAHQPSRTPEERNRRTIYAYRVRGQADPMLEIMNLPNPNESCELRDSASVTPQAFTLLNSDVMQDRAIAFALRVQQGAASQAWIREAIELAFGREPREDELQSLDNYYLEMLGYHNEHEPEPVEYPTQVVRSLVEEFTGEPFEFIEKLNVYEDYVPDAKPWTVSPKTRALADVCLLLFNSNEFMFVY